MEVSRRIRSFRIPVDPFAEEVELASGWWRRSADGFVKVLEPSSTLFCDFARGRRTSG